MWQQFIWNRDDKTCQDGTLVVFITFSNEFEKKRIVFYYDSFCMFIGIYGMTIFGEVYIYITVELIFWILWCYWN